MTAAPQEIHFLRTGYILTTTLHVPIVDNQNSHDGQDFGG
jgi:hypothetical protein